MPPAAAIGHNDRGDIHAQAGALSLFMNMIRHLTGGAADRIPFNAIIQINTSRNNFHRTARGEVSHTQRPLQAQS